MLVFANIHAGEVAGKEAALMVLRDIALGRHDDWADSLVVMVAPIYNADGNERVDTGNRRLQNGPVDGMGQRRNADGLDLNRDFMKLASPEARALVGFLRDVDPHVVVDLHTTNGTHMGYHLTYAPPLSPNTPEAIDQHLRDDWLPEISAEILRTDDMATDHYGNVPGAFGEPADRVPRGWYSFSPQPRFGTNYGGVRGRYAILSEAYSYATFGERVHVTKRFVEAILDRAARDASGVRARTEAADRQRLIGETLTVRAFFTEPESTREILMGAVDTLRHPETDEPIYQRLPVRTPETMPVFSRFNPTETQTVPPGYAVPTSARGVLELLAFHGIEFEDAVPLARWEEFEMDSVRTSPRAYEGVFQQEAFGEWVSYVNVDEPQAPANSVWVPMDQPLARLAFMLLEPRSDDGVVNWAIVPLDGVTTYPILRGWPAE
ncbi:MAG: M14 family metallopeptidase [Bacteroidota bacterium]